MYSTIKGKKFKTREDAKENKSSRYYTGNKCPHGHLADRFTSNSLCVECLYIKSYSKEEIYKRNVKRKLKRKLDSEFRKKESIESLKRYHKKVSTAKGRKETQEQTNQYWHSKRKPILKKLMETDIDFAEYTRKKARESQRKRRELPKVKENEKKISRRYREKNPGMHRYFKAMRRARVKKATPPWLSQYQKNLIKDLYKESEEKTKSTGIQHHVDHIVPLDFYENVKGLHVPWNLQILDAKEHKRKTSWEQKKKRKDFKTGKITAIYDEDYKM